MGDTCERTGYEAVQLSTENDTEYVSSGISDMAGAVAGLRLHVGIRIMLVCASTFHRNAHCIISSIFCPFLFIDFLYGNQYYNIRQYEKTEK